MGQAPYDEPDSLDQMRADADQVDLSPVRAAAPIPGGSPEPGGFDVPTAAADLSGGMHVYLD
jgi:hypothetical protein